MYFFQSWLIDWLIGRCYRRESAGESSMNTRMPPVPPPCEVSLAVVATPLPSRGAMEWLVGEWASAIGLIMLSGGMVRKIPLFRLISVEKKVGYKAASLSWDGIKGVLMASKGLQMDVYPLRSTTTEAKFGQALESGQRRFPSFEVGHAGSTSSPATFFLFFSFCNSHSTENISFWIFLLMNGNGINLDRNDITHRISRISYRAWLKIKIILLHQRK